MRGSLGRHRGEEGERGDMASRFLLADLKNSVGGDYFYKIYRRVYIFLIRYESANAA